jgi:predicted glycosyltransferase
LPKVWIDVLTPKQVLLFTPLVDELRASGCEVLATSRKYREVGPIARMQRLDLLFVGERGGSSRAEQLAAATLRQASIAPKIKRFGPDISVSVASGVCARVSYGLGIRHIAVNDSPHSEVAGRLSLPLSYHLFCPWVIPYTAWAKFGVPRSKISRYHALDPAAWLKRTARRGPVPRLNPKRSTIVVRLEESYAPYMAGMDRSWNEAVLTAIGDSFPDSNLVALCRYGDQLLRIKAKFGRTFVIPEKVVDGRGLLEATDVFVGMGGTMSAEAALMGVPTISAFQGSLFTEDYLTSVGLLYKARNGAEVARLAKRFLANDYEAESSRRAKKVLDAMEDPIPKIAKYIVANAKQA